MIENVIIEPMTEGFILWRCLHSGPLSRDNIDQWPSGNKMPWERFRERNIPLLRKLTRTYGACAIVARDGEEIVGLLRFYPKAVCNMEHSRWLCLQQDFPAGPAEDFLGSSFPALAQMKDKTLVVHCLMAGSPQQVENPYQRKGIGTRMVRTLIKWAKANGWERIEADSFEDLPLIYKVTGSAGHTFWEKLGFYIADRHPHPHLQDGNEFARMLEEQARSIGISSERARDRLVMRLDLTESEKTQQTAKR